MDPMEGFWRLFLLCAGAALGLTVGGFLPLAVLFIWICSNRTGNRSMARRSR